MSFRAAKCPNCGGSLQVPADVDAVKCMYCGGDIVVREAVRLAAGRVKEFTVARADEKIYDESKPFLAGNERRRAYKLIAVAAGIGVLLMLIGGEVGLFLGACIVLTGLIGGAVYISSLKRLEEADEAMSEVPPRRMVLRYKGQCPYCDTSIWLPPVPGADCPACKKRVVIKDSKFYSVDTPVSGLK
jgi:DNA-directed RNA polymerase subunit RPC12/RpoP